MTVARTLLTTALAVAVLAGAAGSAKARPAAGPVLTVMQGLPVQLPHTPHQPLTAPPPPENDVYEQLAPPAKTPAVYRPIGPLQPSEIVTPLHLTTKTGRLPAAARAPQPLKVFSIDDLPVAADLAGTEPSEAQDGSTILFTGNRFAAYSTDGGASWKALSIDAVFGTFGTQQICCDPVVIYIPSIDRFAWIAQFRSPDGQYRNASGLGLISPADLVTYGAGDFKTGLLTPDAARTPELYFLAAARWREALAEVLAEALPAGEAESAARAVLRGNALALYALSS
jgi:hypothetical protein